MKYFYLLSFTVLSFTIKAQNELLYKMDSTAIESNQINPALLPKYSIGIQLFGVNVNFRGLPYNFSNLNNSIIDKENGILGLEKLLKNYPLKGDNIQLTNDADMSLLNVVYRQSDSMAYSFSFGMRHRLRVNLPSNIINILNVGNFPYVGKTVDIDGISAYEYSYIYLGIGFTTKITEDLTTGFRLKVLKGFNYTGLENMNLQLTTDKETYNLGLKIKDQSKIRTSGYKSHNNDDPKNFKFESKSYLDGIFGSPTKNLGVALDIGATYNVYENVNLYFSTTDIGFIYFNEQVSHHNYRPQEFSYTSKTLDEFRDFKFSQVTDDLKSMFKTNFTNGNSFVKWLQTNTYIGADYDFKEYGRFGAMFTVYDVLNEYMSFKPTITYNYNIGTFLNIALAPSYHRDEFLIGFGLNLDLYAFQINVLTDNILTAIIPQHSKSINLMFSIAFLFDAPKEVKEVKEIEWDLEKMTLEVVN